ncbi:MULTISPECIES: ABC transporter ATP-binding protein [Nocardia]|uniref:ABC transporter ATP-binding protein n=1 Tax=Nocardia TaxID=1817 RepID=UPI0007EAC7FB|nr:MULTISPECIES: ABC transporter ATP-binding protein [Nocardia]MBF6272351.1 ABC transporter ATP-binding protein [Nocardia nova]OBA41519.1 ABC transporter [Nocardia sp. 852002-51101_SCH5132738]OBB40606.1 ABC transporter [Nocardia sp. 852002-51244_SCH5132740]OBF84094.1 ABC transporter [Mycobacterium sp. 852002-51759_SCH5129042]
MIRKIFALVPLELRRYVPRHVALIGAGALGQIAAYLLLIPVLQALFDGDFGRAWRWTAWLALAVIVASVCSYQQLLVGLRIGVGMLRGVQTRLGDHLSTLPLGWFATANAGSLSRMVVGGVREILSVVNYLLAPVLTAVLVPVGVAIGVAFIDWRIALVILISLPVLLLVSRWANTSYTRADRRLDAAAAEANSRVVEFAQAQPVLRAFGAVGVGNRALTRALREQEAASKRMIVASVPGLMVFALCVQIVFLIVVSVVVARGTGGDLSIPATIALIAVTSRFIEPINRAAQLSTAIRSAADAADRITNFLAERDLAEAAEPVTPGAPEIVFDNVDFGYREGEKVIDGVSFTVPSGTTTAIVGPSGGGKTTLLKLASRFYDVGSGSITVGGHDVRRQPSETLLRQVSPVFQDVYLFNETISDNIRVGNPDATTEQVRRAAEIARVDEIVDRLPDGWDSAVGEGGAALSGGERQRVSIARALLKDAPIVLLDEATSALDPPSEAAVVRGIHELTRDKTVVVVAHRLDTIAHADQILFVEAGRIVERGTHAELLELGGRYAGFWSERSRATGWHLVSA